MASDSGKSLTRLTSGPVPPTFSESDRPVAKAVVQPVLRFMRLEAAGGILMIIAAIIAVAWANSPAQDLYFTIFDAKIEIVFGEFHFHHLSELTVQEWINDAAMVFFFFLVGLEIKREVMVGELNSVRKAALPAIAALGGMVVPAAIYLFFTAGEPSSNGWGVPMATDIAFAIGIVALVGNRVPLAAKLFLLALAIVDDLGAILVIAIVYVKEPAFTWLIPAAVGLLVVLLMQRANVRAVPAYVLVGAFVWLCVLESGVHATLAGVILAMMTPLSSFHSAKKFPRRSREVIDHIESHLPDEDDLREVDHHTQARVDSYMSDLRTLTRETIPPLTRLETTIQPWTSYVIVPLFALANAGVILTADSITSAPSEPVFLGVAMGLVVGKIAGIVGFTWLAVKLGLGDLPRDTTWSHIFGLAMLAAIGFTVALFVATLAFTEPAFVDQAKIGIYAASILAGIGGYVWLRFVAPDTRVEKRPPPSAPESRSEPVKVSA